MSGQVEMQGSSDAKPSPVRRWLPVAVAVLLLVLVFSQIAVHDFVQALAHVDYLAFGAVTVASTLLLLAADALAIREVYSPYVCPVTLRQAFILRGASYLPQLLNYHLGQAWMAWFAARVYGVSLARVAGATLLIYATMFAGLLLLTASSFAFASSALAWLAPLLLLVSAAGAGYLCVLARPPKFLRKVPALEVLFEAGVAGNLRALLFRLPHIVVLFLGMWVPFSLFGVHIPLSSALVCIPPLLLVGALPLTPQGVGTRDALALQLLSPFAPHDEAGGRAAVAAATLSWAVGLTLVHFFISPILMRSAQKLLALKEASDVPHPSNG